LAIIILPMVLYYTGIASSAAAGTAAVGVLVLFDRVDFLVRQDFSKAWPHTMHRATPSVLVLFIVALIVAHAAVAWIYQPFDFQHFLASLAPLIIVIMAGCCVGQLLEEQGDARVDRAIRWCFLFFCLSAIGGVLGFAPPSPRLTTKPVFPFNEPSHFGIIFTPFLIFCCIRARGAGRYAVWFVGILIAASLQNLTLVAGCAVAALCFVRGLAVVPVLLLAGGVGMVIDLSYYLSRVDLLSDNPNLSVLTYIQGWQLMGESLRRSLGWGLGFQQLGLHGSDVPASQLIFSQTGEADNLLDGAFNAAKLISEFGVFGILMSLWFSRLWWRSMRSLRRIAGGAACASAELFAMCLVAGYFVELLVRGAGYFTGSGMLLIGAFWIMSAKHVGVRKMEVRVARGANI
jgi:hypothetical protein